MPKALDDTPWLGSDRFVVGLDIGTAHSSVTFSHLEHGKLPQNYRVTHWPSATGAGGSSDAKTASVLYYDKSLQLKAAGAAVLSPTMRHNARVNGWHLVRYFKLQLHPSTMIKPQDLEKFHFEALPEGLDIERVYADMIRYMIDHTHDFLEQRNGIGTWRQLSRIMTLVIAHPNGWGPREQKRLRAAVVQANVFGEREATDRVKFVSEAEAAVHYILWEKSQELQPGDEVIVCDAGGSTADTTAYRVEKKHVSQPTEIHTSDNDNNIGIPPKPSRPPKKKFFRWFRKTPKNTITPVSPGPATGIPPAKASIMLKEIKASDCQPAGGVFVNEALVTYLKDRFYDLPPDQADALAQCLQKSEDSFELNCKREFSIGKDAPSEYVVETGAGISGYVDSCLLIEGKIVQGFFEEPVGRIITSIEKQTCGINPRYIFVVGGFGTSKYLRQRVEETFRRGRAQVLFLDDAHGKAASDGSVIWFIRKGVTARAVRMSFGVNVHLPYDWNSLEHKIRPREYLADGRAYVEGSFAVIAEKDHVYDETMSSKRTYTRKFSTPNPNLGEFSITLFAWTNDMIPSPDWVKDPEGNIIDGFEEVCTIEADMNGTRGGLTKRRGQQGDYWVLNFDVCIEFGGTELSAHLEWKERGITRRGEATVVVME